MKTADTLGNIFEKIREGNEKDKILLLNWTRFIFLCFLGFNSRLFAIDVLFHIIEFLFKQ